MDLLKLNIDIIETPAVHTDFLNIYIYIIPDLISMISASPVGVTSTLKQTAGLALTIE